MPLDEALGIAPHQGSSEELMRLGCLLSVMMPYEQASSLLMGGTLGKCEHSLELGTS